ncbi:MAG: nitric oxide reductase, partial [Rhodocyclaceae bacterium]
MEEFVGGLWHRLITRAAHRAYPDAAVRLADMEKTAGVLFRAFGGDAGLRVAAASATRHGARRRVLQRVAGLGDRTEHASRDDETLQLPGEIAVFAESDLNRDLYLWLVALAASDSAADDPWIVRNQRATQSALARFPGIGPRYLRLVDAALAQRIAPERLPPAEAEVERAVRQALRQPGSVEALPGLPSRKIRPPQPVPLWLYPSFRSIDSGKKPADTVAEDRREGTPPPADGANKRRRARHTESPDGKSGFLMMFRAESLLSMVEYVKVDRPLDDDPDAGAAQRADELDELAVTRDSRSTAARVKFDLDLPAAAHDDLPVGEGVPLPEWDFRKRLLRPDYCRAQVLVARDALPCDLPAHLRKPAQKLRAQFAALQPARRWLKSQPEGAEPDLDACVRAIADRAAGNPGAEVGTYLAQLSCERDLACLVLADLSLSTDAWVTDHARVIDVVKDTLSLFAEALSATGDAFALYGFSSLKRGNVRMHQ